MKSFVLNKRRQIDKVDRKIVSLLEKRFKIVFGLREYKRKHNMPIEDLDRESEIKEKFKYSKLPKGVLVKFFKLLFMEAKK